MPSTYSSLYVHLIFATKDRQPLIDVAWQERLHEYPGGLLRGAEAQPLGIGGVADHVHLLVGLKPTHRLSDLLRDSKKDSTVWVQREFELFQFAWQVGYAAFTVSPTARPSVRHYIARQAEHHRTLDYRTELIDLLKRAGIEYDERYLD